MGQIANQMVADLVFKIGKRIKEKKAEKAQKPAYNYDPEDEKAVIRAGICNGEQVAGFKNIRTGAFHEVMLIKTEADKELFFKTYGLKSAEKEY